MSAAPLRYDFPKPFKRRLKKKTADQAAAVMRCVHLLATDPRHPGLHVHKVKSTDGVFEAYVDRSNRVTFHWGEEGQLVFRNHCSHDILERHP